MSTKPRAANGLSVGLRDRLGLRLVLTLALAVSSATVLGLGEATALAQEREPRGPAAFGAPRQLSLNVDLALMSTTPYLGVVHTDQGNQSRTDWYVVPSVDFFVIPHLSVGLLLGYTKHESSVTVAGISASGSISTIQAGARVGYDFVLGKQASLWPRLSLIYAHSTTTSLGQDTNGHTLGVNIFVPLLWHPVPHFFLGGGPLFATELSNELGGRAQSKGTSYGLQGIIGGYFGG